jgi:hypothetical protein
MKRSWGAVLSAGALGIMLYAAGPSAMAASSPALAGNPQTVAVVGSLTDPAQIAFTCEVHGTVPLAAISVNTCKLYRRTATGWQFLASGPQEALPGQAVATGGRYELPAAKLSSLKLCWSATALTRSNQFVSASGCQISS